MKDKTSEYLKGTLKELESAFQEWDKVIPAIEKPEDTENTSNPNSQIREKTKSILDKLKNQIEELSE